MYSTSKGEIVHVYEILKETLAPNNTLQKKNPIVTTHKIVSTKTLPIKDEYESTFKKSKTIDPYFACVPLHYPRLLFMQRPLKVVIKMNKMMKVIV